MIKIVACTLVKEGMEEQYKEAARELVKCSSAEEGNITYTLNQDINNPRSFAMIEIWKDQEAIDKHNASEHFTTIVPKLGEMAEGKSLTIYREVEY
ncbi:MAG: antibiotic biosynthesis monooxygenase [Parasporobacterium sp.]|nr:antibiotic biosynthesis monooxygenase [Parasporobacterium sp.]